MAVSNGVPVIVLLVNDSVDSFWKVKGLPHSVGREPVNLLLPRYNVARDGSVPLLPQDAGSVPVTRRLQISSTQRTKQLHTFCFS